VCVKPRINGAPGYQQDATVPGSKRGDIGIGGGTASGPRRWLGLNQEKPMSKTSTTIALAIAATLTGSFSSFAQNTGASGGTAAVSGSAVGTPNAGSAGAGTTGVSGIPSGPGSVGGVNNSVNDPSGIGNAAKVPPPPPPSTSPTGR
jgi:hypothetical protein